MTSFIRISQKLVFHQSKCICAMKRILFTTAMYVSSSSFMYLRTSCYCDACLNSSDLRVGVTTLLNTIQYRLGFRTSAIHRTRHVSSGFRDEFLSSTYMCFKKSRLRFGLMKCGNILQWQSIRLQIERSPVQIRLFSYINTKYPFDECHALEKQIVGFKKKSRNFYTTSGTEVRFEDSTLAFFGKPDVA